MISPRLNTYLLGQETAEKIFLDAWKSGTLHNSWLIGGIEGIGKATFAYRAARFLLAADESKKEHYQSLDIPADDPACRLIANLSHPDLKILERDYIETDKKKIIKAIKDGDALDEDELKTLKKSAIIKVDDVRTINEFLSKKSFDGHWRIVIVDSVDDLNTAGANAILKILEEPPAKSIIFLISHNPYRLLPTIRSRCAKLNLQPLNENQVASLLRRYHSELSEKQVKGLAHISGGSIGRALNYAENNAVEIYGKLEKLFYSRADFDLSEALSLAQEASKNEDVWDLMIELFSAFVSENLRNGENVLELSEAWEKIQNMFRDAQALNMDKRQVVLLAISQIAKAFS